MNGAIRGLGGKVALVTGSSRGIGRAIAMAMARAGAAVAINYRTHAEQAFELRSSIEEMGGTAIAVRGDVSIQAQAEHLVVEAANALGGVDILVNNAGIARPRAFEEITAADWDELMAANLKSCFLMTQAVVPGMRARKWGRVINVSSVAAQVGGVVGPHYAASKAGIHGLTHFYASRLAKEGITVNAIAPALVETDMVAANPDARADLIPVGRFGRPEEVAEAALMLALNGYVTGQTINVNGGWYMS